MSTRSFKFKDESVSVFATRSGRRGVSNSLIVGYLPPTETTPDLIPLIIHLPRKIDILLSFFRRLFRTTCIASPVALYVLSVCFLTIRGKMLSAGNYRRKHEDNFELRTVDRDRREFV